MRTASEATLPITVDRDDERPLPSQLSDEIRRVIADGLVSPGEALPASRTLASQLAVSRGTVVAAYDQLIAEGYLSARAGRSTVVNPALSDLHPTPPKRPPVPDRSIVQPGVIDLRPGRPWTDQVPNAAWRAAWRQAAAIPPVATPPAGLAALRTEVCEHLRRMRGVVCDPSQVLITAGAREGFALLLAALGPGQSVGVEDPGYPSLRRVPHRLGAAVTPLPTDQHGLVCDRLPSGDDAPDLLVVTPSHQYPLGGSLPVARRFALLDWAAREDAWLIEDDFDAELRYTSRPLPALASLDDPGAGRVVMLGTFAKTLGPGLGAGYLVAPPGLVPALVAARADLGLPVSQTVQIALARYLASGELRRHVQRMRRHYRRRRALVLEVLGGIPGVVVQPMDGGLHAVVELPGSEQPVIRACAERGILVAALSAYWSRPAAGAAGLVLGYGGVDEASLRQGLALLATVLGQSLRA